MDAQIKKSVDEILSSTDLTFKKESFIYTYTNEDIKGYLSYFDLQDKNILTVTGSGDHVLNMLFGVDEIDTFDINIFAYYFLILKKYALYALELDEYLDFLSMKTPNFDMKTFSKIKRIWQSEREALEFFEYIFNLNQAPYLKKTSLFVNNKVEDEKENIKRNNYLEEHKYYELKKSIMDKTITFHHSNIKALELNKKFDYIFISNITDYLQNMFSGDLLRSYKKFLYARIIPMLKQNGKLISYMYNGKMGQYTNEEVRNILQYKFNEKEVGNDKILIYEK